MAKRAEGITQKLLECAKEEFLQKGFINASLRTIAKKAGSSKGAIYVRFPDKESLFAALVQPQVEGITQILESARNEFTELPDTVQMEKIKTFSDHAITQMIEYIYDHFDIFKLLTTCSEGTPYSNFIHDLVEVDMKYNMKFLEGTGRDMLTSGRCTPELLHILTSAFYSGIFEIVIHNMTRKDSHNFIKRLRIFFGAGWNTMLYP